DHPVGAQIREKAHSAFEVRGVPARIRFYVRRPRQRDALHELAQVCAQRATALRLRALRRNDYATASASASEGESFAVERTIVAPTTTQPFPPPVPKHNRCGPLNRLAPRFGLLPRPLSRGVPGSPTRGAGSIGPPRRCQCPYTPWIPGG